MKTAKNNTDILIVGGGPVGLSLALFLDMYGVKSVLFNSDEVTRWHPKGNNHNQRTMEHYRRLGIADDLRKLGLPQDHPLDIAYFDRFSRHEIARFSVPSKGARLSMRAHSHADDQFVEPMSRINQMYVEEYLQRHARTRPNITMRFGWTVTGNVQSDNDVRVTAKNKAGEEETWSAHYLVGCDGSKSDIRRSLDIKYEREEALLNVFMGGRFVSIHMSIPDLYPKYMADRRAWMYLAVNKDTRAVLMSLNGADEFMMHKPVKDGEGLDEAQVINWVKTAIGADIPVRIVAHRPWSAGGYLVAERFQSGRIFLAGDAVHLFTPTGGFGMNTGVDDTANLSWKLAAMVQGWGGPRLLESYELERKPVAIKNTTFARHLGKAWQDIHVPPEFEDDTPAGDAARAEAARSSFVLENHFILPEEKDCLGIVWGARYDASPVLARENSPQPNEHHTYTPSSVPGGRAPHFWLDETRERGASLYDQLGLGFTLLRVSQDKPDCSALVAAAAKRRIPLKIIDASGDVAATLYEKPLTLIRPDQHVAWRGDRLPEDIDELLNTVTGVN
jgi:2-polyprenyl-6-methoxyphenol hydroxylase-like FAD-dependent oxidoreductase